MAFKAASIVVALDGDPTQHRSTIKTGTIEHTTVLTPLKDPDSVPRVAKELVQEHGVQSLTLCPGYTHDVVAKVREAVGPEVAINVARGDVPSTMMLVQVLRKEGWIPESR